MNESLLIRNICLEYLFLGLPLTIVFLKMILCPIFHQWYKSLTKQFNKFKVDLANKYQCYWSFIDFYASESWLNEKKDDRISPEERLKKYPDIENDYKKYKELSEHSERKFVKIIYSIYDFLSDLSAGDLEEWFVYCVISWVLEFICALLICGSVSRFKSQKAFYDNGKYTALTVFEDFEKFPGWKENAKPYIELAEKLNKNYFNENGKVIKSSVKYIIPDENGNYPILDENGKLTNEFIKPVNTNKMYSSFLSLCENKEEVLK